MAPAAVQAPYNPSELEARNFWHTESLRQRSDVHVPEGLPSKIQSSLAWIGADVSEKSSEWSIKLTSEEVLAIETALQMFEAKYDDLSAISTSTFELPPGFAARLKQISEQLYQGYGFQVVHGLEPSKYTQKQNVIIYAGISAHICPQRGFVDPFGGVITHIVNVQGDDMKTGPKAPAFGKTPLSFHTDNCEIMAFYCLDAAVSGGETLLSSSWQVYNELAEKRPDVIRTLSEPWWMDTYKSYETHPLRHWRPLTKTDSDRVLLRFSRYGITGWQHQRNQDLPPPTKAQLDAIDAVHFTAMKNAVEVPLAKGDLLFVNDMALMHGRRAFDEGGQYLKRHIMKMFLRDPEKNWVVPQELVEESMWKYAPNQPDGTRKETWNISHQSGLEEAGPDNG